MTTKALKQRIESRKRTEEFCEMFEEELGIELDLNEAEDMLTKIGLNVAKEEGVEALLDTKE